MYTKNVFAAGALLSVVVVAVPMAKRDIVWVTETDEAVVTVPVTTTVWVDPTSSATHFGHHWHSYSPVTSSSAETSSAESTSASVAPSSYSAPSSSSVYVAPTTNSTSVYVVPTTSSVYVAPTTSSVYVAPTTSSVYVAPTTSSVYVAPTTSSVYVAPTTSSVYVAPTTSSVYVAPTTSSTSVYVAPTTSSTSSAPAATSSAASSTGSVSSGPGAAGTSYTGDITYYTPGMGACGWTSTTSDAIVAISETIFDVYTPNGNPNNNPLCGKTVTIVGTDGSTYDAEIVDRCVGCDEESIDLSPSMFTIVAPDGDGRVHNVAWSFKN